MLAWPLAAIFEKNRLASDAPFLTLLKLTHESLSEPVYLARNTEDVQWNGITWEAYAMEFGTDTTDGQQDPSFQITVSNAGGILQEYLQKYKGLGGAEVNIYLVHENYLDNTDPLFELDFVVESVDYDEKWLTFKLSSSPEIANQFPPCTYAAHYCPYKFKSLRCGYSGSGGPCKNTDDSCLIPERFGGEEGMNSV